MNPSPHAPSSEPAHPDGPTFPEEQYTSSDPGYYDRVYRRGRGTQWFWHEHRFRQVERLLPAPPGRILDLGCGPGTFLGRTKVPFSYGLGIDLSPGQIDYAQKTYGRPGLEFRCGDVRELVDNGERFDAVTSIEVIEHLPPDGARQFLDSIRNLLLPGGVAVLTTPNYASFWPLLERLVSAMGPVDYRIQHINRYTAGRLSAEVEASGLKVDAAETFFVISPFLAPLGARVGEAVLRAENRLLPRAGTELVVRARRPEGA